jgi:hypothetical protein
MDLAPAPHPTAFEALAVWSGPKQNSASTAPESETDRFRLRACLTADPVPLDHSLDEAWSGRP